MYLESSAEGEKGGMRGRGGGQQSSQTARQTERDGEAKKTDQDKRDEVLVERKCWL